MKEPGIIEGDNTLINIVLQGLALSVWLEGRRQPRRHALWCCQGPWYHFSDDVNVAIVDPEEEDIGVFFAWSCEQHLPLKVAMPQRLASRWRAQKQ